MDVETEKSTAPEELTIVRVRGAGAGPPVTNENPVSESEMPGALLGLLKAIRHAKTLPMRLAGMMLPGKGWPVSGSMSGLANPLKSPWRSCAVGTYAGSRTPG